MAQMNSFLLIILLSLALMFPSPSASQEGKNKKDYVENACSVTLHRDLCIHSLASFSNTAKDNPSIWARAGVSVTIAEAKKVSLFLATLKRSKHGSLTRGRNKVAISDCVESFQVALDNLHRSLGVLRKLVAGEFSSQMQDVTTWVSAALTDEDTCVGGFGEQNGTRVRFLINRVSSVTYMTSNALALVNKLATTGPECLRND